MARLARTLPLVALLLGLSSPASEARADVRSGDDKFLHGDYSDAADAYRAVKGKDAARAQVTPSTRAFMVGVGFVSEDRFHVRQYVMRDYEEEAALRAARQRSPPPRSPRWCG